MFIIFIFYKRFWADFGEAFLIYTQCKKKYLKLKTLALSGYYTFAETQCFIMDVYVG